MPSRRPRARGLGLVAAATVMASACASNGGTGGNPGTCTPQESPVITLAAYSNVYDVYGKLISNFQTEWKDSHDGQQVIFQTSFGGSTTQAQNVVNGFPADIVALSLAPDVQMIEDAGLITHDWTQEADAGIVATSVVVFDVRPGNPKHIENWDDLTQPGLEILTPDPAQSGGARWNIVAAYGAALRGHVPGYAADDPAAAEKLLEGIFANVTVMDKSANDSIKNFESGNGDVAITYENEVLTANKAGLPDEMVIPPSTVLIENPVAVVDANAEDHCVKDVADAFVDYLFTDEVKDLYSSVGFLRPADRDAAAEDDGDMFPAIDDLFTVEDLGGWDQIDRDVFGDEGAFTTAFERAQD